MGDSLNLPTSFREKKALPLISVLDEFLILSAAGRKRDAYRFFYFSLGP
jgi:hypothetical protein